MGRVETLSVGAADGVPLEAYALALLAAVSRREAQRSLREREACASRPAMQRVDAVREAVQRLLASMVTDEP